MAETEMSRERLQAACETLGRVVEAQCNAALDATGLHDWIDEDGDGDWGAIWENLAELRPRLLAAEAKVARVEAMAAEWDRKARVLSDSRRVRALRAALDGPQVAGDAGGGDRG